MQYSIQGLNCEDPDRKDLLMAIGTEELSHLEIVGTLARMHLKLMKFDRQAAEADPLIAIAGGGGVNLFNSQGNAWTADYLKITGELDVDLRSNIAAEARAKIVYERLINFCDNSGTKDALQFLMTREITHMKAFSLALESMSKPAFSIGRIAPTPGLVDQFFDDSTGTGEHGEIDTRGPWNEGNGWVFTEISGNSSRTRSRPRNRHGKFVPLETAFVRGMWTCSTCSITAPITLWQIFRQTVTHDRITKEPLWQSPSKEEKRENNSDHSLLVHVFTQPGTLPDVIEACTSVRLASSGSSSRCGME